MLVLPHDCALLSNRASGLAVSRMNSGRVLKLGDLL